MSEDFNNHHHHSDDDKKLPPLAKCNKAIFDKKENIIYLSDVNGYITLIKSDDTRKSHQISNVNQRQI